MTKNLFFKYFERLNQQEINASPELAVMTIRNVFPKQSRKSILSHNETFLAANYCYC